jgi:hypothetical protein
MPDKNEPINESLTEVRKARAQAETLRDQLSAEYEHLREEDTLAGGDLPNDPRHQQGMEAMRKAITAADRAIASIDQALRQMERINDGD